MPFVSCLGYCNKVLLERNTALFMSSHKRKKIAGTGGKKTFPLHMQTWSRSFSGGSICTGRKKSCLKNSRMFSQVFLSAHPFPSQPPCPPAPDPAGPRRGPRAWPHQRTPTSCPTQCPASCRPAWFHPQVRSARKRNAHFSLSLCLSVSLFLLHTLTHTYTLLLHQWPPRSLSSKWQPVQSDTCAGPPDTNCSPVYQKQILRSVPADREEEENKSEWRSFLSDYSSRCCILPRVQSN